MDFEITPITILNKLLVGCTFFGCHFHFAQIIWRFIQRSNMTARYKQDVEFKNFVRLPIACTRSKDEYNKILTHFQFPSNDADYNNFKKYFSDNFLSNNTSTSIQTHETNFWSVSFRVINNIPTTTNSLEAWHRNINSKTVVVHPNITKFISMLQKEELKTAIRVTQLKDGKGGSRIRLRNSAVKNIVGNYSLYTGLEYISTIIRNTELKFD
jgi:hypothetical protein